MTALEGAGPLVEVFVLVTLQGSRVRPDRFRVKDLLRGGSDTHRPGERSPLFFVEGVSSLFRPTPRPLSHSVGVQRPSPPARDVRHGPS